MADESRSIVEIFDEPFEGHRCGYCKSTKGSLSYGMWAHTLTVYDYQSLIDRGWRRSGKYCYKPMMTKTCCPLYTIRCDTSDFQLSNSQKKVLRRMHRYLSFGDNKDESDFGSKGVEVDDYSGSGLSDSIDFSHVQKTALLAEHCLEDKKVNVNTAVEKHHCKDDVNVEGTSHTNSSGEVSARQQQSTTDGRGMQSQLDEHQVGKTQPKPGEGANPSKPPCKKAKLLRKERRLQKLSTSSSQDLPRQKNIKKTLQDYLSEPLPENPAHTLEIKVIRSQSTGQFQQTFQDTHNIYEKYQMTIHNDSPDKCNNSQYKRFLVDSPLEIKLVKCQGSDFTSALEESYDKYTLYQMGIHNEGKDEIDFNSYWDFLVSSPLEFARPNQRSQVEYGSFHQQYWLDGNLIAVGVIDILPFCVSAVYFYYDPKYSFLSLGTYGSLREIALVQELNELNRELRYYYMGYYIHSCPKMRYKGQYNPSMLLCPEAYTWCPIEQARRKLDITKYSRLETSDKEDEGAKIDLANVMVLYKRTAMPFCRYRSFKKKLSDGEPEQVMKYAKFVGNKCIVSMLLYRS